MPDAAEIAVPAPASNATATAQPITVTITQTITISQGDIAQRAYELYEADGFADGHDLKHWLAAEAELRGKRR
ncbi:MAG: DUF2934 domain-containing protein [Acidobacteriaceae bacterium]|nr:DUF2934 domain-containing protein [Acidobacteriaceae bacterium]